MTSEMQSLVSQLEAIKAKEKRLDDKLKDVIESKGRVSQAGKEVEKQIAELGITEAKAIEETIN